MTTTVVRIEHATASGLAPSTDISKTRCARQAVPYLQTARVFSSVLGEVAREHCRPTRARDKADLQPWSELSRLINQEWL